MKITTSICSAGTQHRFIIFCVASLRKPQLRLPEGWHFPGRVAHVAFSITESILYEIKEQSGDPSGGSFASSGPLDIPQDLTTTQADVIG